MIVFVILLLPKGKFLIKSIEGRRFETQNSFKGITQMKNRVD